MSLIRAAFGWIGRKAALFALIVAALVAWQMLAPSFQGYGEMRARVATLDAAAAALPAITTDAVVQGEARVANAQRGSVAQIDARLAVARRQRTERQADRQGDLAALVGGGPEAVIANRRAAIEIALLTREIEALRIFRDTLDLRRPGESLSQAVRRQTAVMRLGHQRNREARAAIARIDASNVFARVTATAQRQRHIEAAAASAKSYRDARANAERLISAQSRLNTAAATASGSIAATRAELSTLARDEGRKLGGNAVERLRGWAERVGLAGKAWTALLMLAGIVLMPLLIRTLFYHVLAPIAARRPAIRIRVPGDSGVPPVVTGDRSAVSLGLRLDAGEELLVRQGFLQASSGGGEKRTRWLLDWRHPFASIAAGLTFLTRIRGGADDLTTISAVDDPFAEVAQLALPAGAACVLHPRALVAVVQPIDRPLRITSHWRLGSLNAWLTLQLRFLVFHGPARLVVKGARGVRIEPATRGRIFGQDQLVGFSADLAYSVTRTETFAPYLFGRESLLKDRVVDGGGVLIVEEAPVATRRGGGVRHGLEGAFDAALKVFGI